MLTACPTSVVTPSLYACVMIHTSVQKVEFEAGPMRELPTCFQSDADDAVDQIRLESIGQAQKLRVTNDREDQLRLRNLPGHREQLFDFADRCVPYKSHVLSMKMKCGLVDVSSSECLSRTQALSLRRPLSASLVSIVLPSTFANFERRPECSLSFRCVSRSPSSAFLSE